MAKPMILKRGKGMNLAVGAAYNGGLGWDTESDLDLAFLRRQGGVYVPVTWFNKDWFKKDADGKVVVNSQGNPVIEPPEGDITHWGDDRTGQTSATGYDEKFDLLTGRTPADVDEYIAFATVYDEQDEGLTLGVGGNMVCGVKDVNTGQELQTDIFTEFGMHVTARLVRWTKNPQTGVWQMVNDPFGYEDADIFTVFQRNYKVVIPPHWNN